MTDYRLSVNDLEAKLRQSEAMREAQINNVKVFTDENIRLVECNLRLTSQLTAMTAERDRLREALTDLLRVVVEWYGEDAPRVDADDWHAARNQARAALERVEKQDEATWVANANAYLTERVGGGGER